MKNQISNPYFSYAVFQALIYFLLIAINYSAPINSSSVTYSNFLKEIQQKNCGFPGKVVLPFKSNNTTFDYLEVYIKICTPSEGKDLKRSREAIKLCSDIFDILKNITCHTDTKVQLPKIEVNFSHNVCADIKSLEFPPETETLLKHLTDSLVCEMMCDDEFNPACQVLLWSYQVQQQINNAVVEQKKNEVDGAVDNVNLESVNTEGAQNEGVTVTENKEILPADEVKKSNNLVPPNNNTAYTKENLKNAKAETLNNEKDKTEKPNIPAKPSSVNANDVDNQENLHMSDKEKDVNHPSSVMGDNIKNDEENQNSVNLDESNLKSNIIQTDNSKQTSTLNKTKQPEPEDSKTVPVEAGLVDEAVSKSQNPVTSEKLPEAAINSNEVETKVKAQTVANVETSSVGNTVSETKDLKVTPEKTKDTIISTLKTEGEKIGVVVEDTNQNIISESSTGEINNLEDMSPITTAADLEKMEDGNEIPEPSDKNQEPYNDMENEGEYSKLDYDDADDGFYDSSKNKKTDLVQEYKMPVVEPQNQLPKYDVYHPRNSVGRGVEDIQVIPAFPEQEDSHFFFYFLSIVLILMGGYLVFHNKQKIIALIVEGRHERRRRSHGVGYKKLDTK